MVMQHKGYIATIEYDDSVGRFHGSVANTRAVITFEGETGRALEREFDASIRDYEAMCAEEGIELGRSLRRKKVLPGSGGRWTSHRAGANQLGYSRSKRSRGAVARSRRRGEQ